MGLITKVPAHSCVSPRMPPKIASSQSPRWKNEENKLKRRSLDMMEENAKNTQCTCFHFSSNYEYYSQYLSSLSNMIFNIYLFIKNNCESKYIVF